jgi:hypothetical protein
MIDQVVSPSDIRFNSFIGVIFAHWNVLEPSKVENKINAVKKRFHAVFVLHVSDKGGHFARLEILLEII